MRTERAHSLHSSGLVAIFAAAVMVLTSVGCTGGGGKKAPVQEGPVGVDPGRISVQVATATEAVLTTMNETAGTVQATTQSNVAARTEGTVGKTCRKAGDWVKAGEKIIQLDDTQLTLAVKTAQSTLSAAKIDLSTNEDTTNQANPKLEMQVRSAQATLAAAQKNYDAQKALLELGGATATQVDTAQSDLQTAQANLAAARTALDQNVKAPAQNLAQLRIGVEKAENALQQAQVNLQYASIKAPFSGQISAINVNPGEYVQPSTTAFSLVSSEREIHFNVPPAHAPLLPVGMRLTFTNEGTSYPVTVKQAPSAPIGGMVPMVASLAPHFSPAFGSVGSVGYTLSLAKGILIPIVALKTGEDKNYVFVIEGGKAVRRTITIVAESGLTAAITGIASGSLVIMNPPPGLLNGVSVQPVATAGSGSAEAQRE
jgi:multidrug efflux pump subunit AcrA (membrane-fusion protein)